MRQPTTPGTARLLAAVALLTAGSISVLFAQDAAPTDTSRINERTTDADRTSGGANAGAATDSRAPAMPAPAGSELRGQPSPHAEAIREVLQEATEDLVTEDLGEVLSYVTDADRRRLGDAFRDGNQHLQQQLTQFRDSWKQKYGVDFDPEDHAAIFPDQFVRIYAGDMGEAARTAAARMSSASGAATGSSGSSASASGNAGSGASADASTDANRSQQRSSESRGGNRAEASAERSGTGSAASGSASASGSGSASASASGSASSGAASGDPRTSPDRASGDRADAGRANVDRGDADRDSRTGEADRVARNMATVVIPASHGAPPVVATLLNEGTLRQSWRIDVPDTIDGQQLVQNLQRHLSELQNSQNQWPEKKDEAYRLVAHHMLAALTDARADTARQAGERVAPAGDAGSRTGTGGDTPVDPNK